MKISIRELELMTINETRNSRTYIGGNQAWYESSWRQRAGCGPTSAANITAYLAFTRAEYKLLYKPQNMNRDNFLQHMNDLYKYITPGPMGVNKVSMFEEGILKFAHDREVSINTNVFVVDSISNKNRNTKQLYEFVEKGLSEDSPIAFLNLSRGLESSLQNWHWITITDAIFNKDSLITTASDEGKNITFDLKLWYETTRMHGGLVYIS